MHVDRIPNRTSPPAFLLRESYREDGKVKKRTLGNRHDRGINHLAATRNVGLGLQMLAKALKQLFNQIGLRKRLSEQPQRRAVRNAVLDRKSVV